MQPGTACRQHHQSVHDFVRRATDARGACSRAACSTRSCRWCSCRPASWAPACIPGDDRLPAVWCDRTMVEQALLNLAPMPTANGSADHARYHPARDRQQEDGQWVSRGRPGRGIAPVAQLFTPFFDRGGHGPRPQPMPHGGGALPAFWRPTSPAARSSTSGIPSGPPCPTLPHLRPDPPLSSSSQTSPSRLGDHRDRSPGHPGLPDDDDAETAGPGLFPCLARPRRCWPGRPPISSRKTPCSWIPHAGMTERPCSSDRPPPCTSACGDLPSPAHADRPPRWMPSNAAFDLAKPISDRRRSRTAAVEQPLPAGANNRPGSRNSSR